MILIFFLRDKKLIMESDDFCHKNFGKIFGIWVYYKKSYEEYNIITNCDGFILSITDNYELIIPKFVKIQRFFENGEQQCLTKSIGCTVIKLEEISKYINFQEIFIPSNCGPINVTIANDFNIKIPNFIGINFMSEKTDECYFGNICDTFPCSTSLVL